MDQLRPKYSLLSQSSSERPWYYCNRLVTGTIVGDCQYTNSRQLLGPSCYILGVVPSWCQSHIEALTVRLHFLFIFMQLSHHASHASHIIDFPQTLSNEPTFLISSNGIAFCFSSVLIKTVMNPRNEEWFLHFVLHQFLLYKYF